MRPSAQGEEPGTESGAATAPAHHLDPGRLEHAIEQLSDLIGVTAAMEMMVVARRGHG